MKDLSLHILDVAENSVRAGATLIEISVVEDMKKDVLTLQIKDNGKGMAPNVQRRAADPFFTTKRGKRFGMGLALLAQATREAEGKFEMSSTPETGTMITASFRHSHPDRRPMGEMSATLQALVAGNPDVDFVFRHSKGAEITRFDTREMRRP